MRRVNRRDPAYVTVSDIPCAGAASRAQSCWAPRQSFWRARGGASVTIPASLQTDIVTVDPGFVGTPRWVGGGAEPPPSARQSSTPELVPQVRGLSGAAKPAPSDHVRASASTLNRTVRLSTRPHPVLLCWHLRLLHLSIVRPTTRVAASPGVLAVLPPLGPARPSAAAWLHPSRWEAQRWLWSRASARWRRGFLYGQGLHEQTSRGHDAQQGGYQEHPGDA